MKHAKARNCIERAFGILKARWVILRSNSFYPIKTQNYFILGCCLLHNFIRKHMAVDPFEADIDEIVDEGINVVAIIDGNTDTSRGGRGRKRAGTTTRRVWTYAEECELMNVLKELVSRGNKCDNGLRSGYLLLLENMLSLKFPGSDLKGEPHINSKIHVWKRQYVCLKNMLGLSGVGLNSTTYHVEALPEVWDAQIKADPTVRSMMNKSYSYYDKWLDIFGKDRATGEHATDPIDLVNEMLKSAHEQEGETDGNPAFGTHEIAKNKTSSSGAQNFKGKKRKSVVSELTSFVDKLGSYMKSCDDTFNNLALCMGTEYDAKIARTTLNDVMKLISGISLHDKLKVSDELVRNKDRLEYFLSLLSEEQSEYVWMLLDGRL
ncbi:hypothetical protein ACS0TY_030796 [Phlomoides rotata]